MVKAAQGKKNSWVSLGAGKMKKEKGGNDTRTFIGAK